MAHFGIEALSNLLLLAKPPLARSILASSYDRRGGNHDWSNYVRREGKAAVMMESEGPGCITRIWTADPQKGTIRIFIDGNPKPAIEMPFAKLFDHLPLSSGIGGESPENYARSKAEKLPMGHTSYCPIPFQKSIKFTIEPEDDYLYYHINADLFPPETVVGAFDSAETEATRVATQAFHEWEAGTPFVDMTSANRATIDLAPGAEHILLDAKGRGVIRGLRISLPKGLSEHELVHVRENLFVIAHFDDDEPRDPSIRAPIGPMFADFAQEPVARGLLIGKDLAGEYYCFFPMPHHDRAVLKIVNRTVLPLKLSAALLHEPNEKLDRDLRRFRATWHIGMPFGPDHRDYSGVACRLLNLDGWNNVELLYAHGAGHFVGCAFDIDLRDAPTDRAAGEGDEMFFIDDDPRLTMYGTGTEDYLNDAWGIRGYSGPLSGSAIVGEWNIGPQIIGYRLHLPDPVGFARKGRFTLEHGTGNNCSGSYKSVAYWYMDASYMRTRVEERRWEAINNGERKANDPE